MVVNPSDNNPFNKRYDYGVKNSETVSSSKSVTTVNSVVNSGNKVVSNGKEGTSIESSGEIDDKTYSSIVKDLQAEIDQKKQDLKDTKKNRGWLTKGWNSLCGAFGGGDKSKQKEIDNLQAQLKSLEKNPENVSQVYKTIMGKDLSVKTISSLKESSTINSNLSKDQKTQITTLLTQQYEDLKKDFDKTKKNNGWISGGWSAFKNWTGIGASSNKAQTKLDNMKKELDSLKKNPDKLAQAYKNMTGRDLNNDELTKLANGELSLKDASKASASVKKYSDGQKMSTDVFADVVSGIVAVAAVAAAPFTGGTSLLLAAGVGAALKVGLKASDCIGTDKKYGLKDLAYDAVTGSINGLMAPLSSGVGGAVGTGVAKTLGLEAIESTSKAALTQAVKTAGKEVTEEVIEQTAKQAGKGVFTRVLAKQGTEYALKEGTEATAKTFLAKTAAYGADMAVDGTLSGATDGFARALGEGRISDIPQDMLNGALGGLVAAPLIGGGFKIAGRTGNKIANSINDNITFKSVLPEGLSTVFKQGEVGDCNVLSIVDGLMSNPKTAAKFKKSVSTTADGSYQVKIGDNLIKVSKSSLSDEAMSDKTGIRIFEQAYKQLNGGNLDGGFADQVAKDFGLNPVHINSNDMSDELLDKIAKDQDNYVLSMGTRIDKSTGSIDLDAAGGEHYFTVKNIDAKTKKVTLTSTLDSSQKLELSYEDFKKAAISLDGGSVKKTDIGSSVRTADEPVFKASLSDSVAIKPKELTQLNGDCKLIVGNTTIDVNSSYYLKNLKEGEGIILGRAQINPADNTISSQHFQLLKINGKLNIVDLSTNGTRIQNSVAKNIDNILPQVPIANKISSTTVLKPKESTLFPLDTKIIKVGNSTMDLEANGLGQAIKNMKDGDNFILGRADINPKDSAISSQHFQIYKNNGKVYIVDLSRNGTRISNTKVSSNIDYKALYNGVYDSIRKANYTPESSFKASAEAMQSAIEKAPVGSKNIKQGGWSYRMINDVDGDDIVDRISLNIVADPGIISELDLLLSKGTYKNSAGQIVKLPDFALTKGYYKTPQSINGWLTRHDPITMYFDGKVSNELTNAIKEVTQKYARKSANGVPLLGALPDASWVAKEISPNENSLINLYERAMSINPEIAKCIKGECMSDGRWIASSGQVASFEKILEEYAY